MKPVRHSSAFTLIEMLVVIAIIGILAAIALPGLKNFQKGDTIASATRHIQDEVGRARQLAMSQRTTVYMIFCPANFWNDPMYAALPQTEQDKAKKLYDKQLAAYTFVTLRSVGNQPGQLSPRYLSPWRPLPEGAFIPLFKFAASNVFTTIYDPPLPALPTLRTFRIYGFNVTDKIPFPSAEAYTGNPGQRFVTLPYIAFNHLGQVESQKDEYIPLALGGMRGAVDANGVAMQSAPIALESPAGNSTNSFLIIHIDWLTGRARLEKQEVQ